ncbi:MAG: ABC transporter ATP-binding protein [Armatimonadota bacterium]|nr:ABC transporter ATP-binding protein [Armatimonadota bacterium]MDR7421033.1 ABC transporter ATP-binding protein [Armatimonadota bacterium]MDR7453624.1 ABC transporter ATP-binding protein [Armatimonadota bacterium]MDR7456824.1 ABC transporter ATP-binding protein [Armatimonadota bacterium]MDR7495491.1 ABC transporter ATP-binding protein [Armatimonadota bacterium]
MSIRLRLERVARRFGGLQAVVDFSLTASAGERIAIIGPNGAGKTTLFNLISGELAPTGGRIELLGRDVTRMPPHRRAALGLGRTYQLTNLFPRLSVLENTLLAVVALRPMRYVAWWPLAAYRDPLDRAQALLAPLGLWERRDDPVAELSYGEQRQVEIALAMAPGPTVLLLDEPTSGLSAAETRIVHALLQGLPRTITVLLIEHDMGVAFDLADRMVVMHQGRILAEDTPEAVRRNPRVQEIYLGSA